VRSRKIRVRLDEFAVQLDRPLAGDLRGRLAKPGGLGAVVAELNNE
jgi:hypothetical protein